VYFVLPAVLFCGFFGFVFATGGKNNKSRIIGILGIIVATLALFHLFSA